MLHVRNPHDLESVLEPLNHLSLEYNGGWWNYQLIIRQQMRQYRDESDHLGYSNFHPINEFTLGLYDLPLTRLTHQQHLKDNTTVSNRHLLPHVHPSFL